MAENSDGGNWIDKTNQSLGAIGNGYELTPNLRSLHLTNNRIKVIEKLEVCKSLCELVLRQNAIKVLEGLEELHELVDLDLYMNLIEKVEPSCFAGNPKLKNLDLSFNQLRELTGFPSANLANLEELFLIGNKIRRVSDLHSMPKLVMLELGDNRLRRIEALDAVPSLRGLWLGRNKITRIEGLTALTQLRRLSIQSNRIEVIEGLDHLVHLEELYLSHNGIRSMNGVQNLKNLRMLDLGSNFIEHIEYVEGLVLLKDFWINGNKLESFEELYLLQNATQLETVYLEQNPLAKHADYQSRALQILPDSLEQLDALTVEDVRAEIARRRPISNADEVSEAMVQMNQKEEILQQSDEVLDLSTAVLTEQPTAVEANVDKVTEKEFAGVVNQPQVSNDPASITGDVGTERAEADDTV